MVIAAAAVIAGPSIYANTVNGQAAAAPSLQATSSASLDAADADGTWTSQSGSYAGYRVHEVLQGNDVNVVGRTKDVEGTAEVDGGSLAKATVTVQVAKITTPNPHATPTSGTPRSRRTSSRRRPSPSRSPSTSRRRSTGASRTSP